MECECAVAGYCNRYLKVQGARAHQICQGVVLTPDKCEAYRQNWESLARVKRTQIGGPGDQLKSLLAELGITNFAGCNCNSKASQMNTWGVNGCRENFNTIREWIGEAMKKASWSTQITAVMHAATTGIALQIDPTDVAGSLVRIAIERAEK